MGNAPLSLSHNKIVEMKCMHVLKYVYVQHVAIYEYIMLGKIWLITTDMYVYIHIIIDIHIRMLVICTCGFPSRKLYYLVVELYMCVCIRICMCIMNRASGS